MKPVTFPARPLNGGRFGMFPQNNTRLWSAKLNGWRALVHTPTGTIFNRQGQELSIAAEFAEALDELSRIGIEWIDAEGLERRHNIGRGSLILLDAVIPDTASERFKRLLEECRRLQWPLLKIGDRPAESQVCLLKQHAMSDASPTGNWRSPVGGVRCNC